MVAQLTTDPKRRVEVSWGSGNKIARPVSLRVTTRNSPGILADISQAFSAHKINLSEANCRASDDGNAGSAAANAFTLKFELGTSDVRAVSGLSNLLDRGLDKAKIEQWN